MLIANIKFLIIAGLLLIAASTAFLLSWKYSVSAYEKMIRKKF